ncbi:MAG: hypothetical protein V4436_02750 [Patescibacteria group bacterium]
MELLVVISIMLILTSIFILQQNRFNSSTLLRSLAYSVALSVRQAQVYGTSIRENVVGAFDSTTNPAAKAYGIYLSSGSTGSYILFADANNDGQYTSGENVQVFTLNSGYTISKFCATTGGGTQRCFIAGGSSAITNLTILFKRPNPDSCFATSVSTNACQTGAVPTETYSSGYIQVKSGSDTRSVNMTLTGQITVGAQGS